MSGRGIRRSFLALPLLLLAALSTGCATSSGTTADPCADLIVIGARGSTQDPDLNGGVGTEVKLTVEQLARRVQSRSGGTIRIDAVRYDAAQAPTLAAYERNTARGAQMMATRLRTLQRACAESRFALVGFSQGAQVVHQTAARMSAALASRVDLVAMIADPRRHPADAITYWSYAPEPTTGHGRLGSGPAIDTDLRDVAISLCVEGDEICNDKGAPGGRPSAVHRHFYEKAATARITAAQLDAILQHSHT